MNSQLKRTTRIRSQYKGEKDVKSDNNLKTFAIENVKPSKKRKVQTKEVKQNNIFLKKSFYAYFLFYCYPHLYYMPFLLSTPCIHYFLEGRA